MHITVVSGEREALGHYGSIPLRLGFSMEGPVTAWPVHLISRRSKPSGPAGFLPERFGIGITEQLLGRKQDDGMPMCHEL